MRRTVFVFLVLLVSMQARPQCDSLPDLKEFQSLKEKILGNEARNDHELNLRLFSKGHKKGFFFLLHPSIPRFEPYLEMEGFDQLVKQDQALREKALSRAHCCYKVHLPEHFDSAGNYPLLMLFHGGGSDLGRAMKHWHSPYADSRFIKVYLQSYRRYDYGSYGWQSGDPKAENELIGIYKELLAEFPVDSMRVYTAGISAGGTFALNLSLKQRIPVAGFLGFCSGFPIEAVNESGQLFIGPSFKVYIVGGERDRYLASQKQVCTLLEGFDALCKHIIVEGMGHQYPENEALHLEQGLKFLEKD